LEKNRNIEGISADMKKRQTKNRIAELKEYIRANGQVARAVLELSDLLQSQGETKVEKKIDPLLLNHPPPPKLPPVEMIPVKPEDEDDLIQEVIEAELSAKEIRKAELLAELKALEDEE
jgi:hypothetical protein